MPKKPIQRHTSLPSTELPNDPNKGIPIRELLARHGGKFTRVVEKTVWLDETAKPKDQPPPDSEFVPDPNIKDDD